MGAPVEIERKFAVANEDWRHQAIHLGINGQYMVQGYLSRQAERSVRVRIAGELAWLTIKGISRGASRVEFEYSLPLQDAQQLLQMCERPLIEKTRYRLPIEDDSRVWEIDEFDGDNAGLIIAEIELSCESQAVPKPSWLGRELTGEPRFYNSSLSKRPYKDFSAAERL